MKIYTPEISWHNREPVFSVDVQSKIGEDSGQHFYRLASCGGDKSVVIWRAYLENPSNFKDVISDSKEVENIHYDKENGIKEIKNLIDLEVVSTLNLHIKTVNIAKFAPCSNLIATGGDDSYVYIWKLNEDESEENQNSQEDKPDPFNEFDNQITITKEKWKRVSTLRRHIEDVLDLSWSADEKYLVTGSVDNLAYVWDVKKSEVLYSLSKHDGYVQGVAWDPLNKYIATLSSDRNLRFFNISNKKLIGKLNKYSLKINETTKNSFLFYDDTLATISRRLSFSPNGELLVVPSGIIETYDEDDNKETDKFINVAHVFVRDNLKKLHCYIPTDSYSTSVKFCSQLFKLRENIQNLYPFPYRLVFAIACKSSVLIYDTQQQYPIAKINDIHYTKLSDLTWTSERKNLIVSSTDGFCTFIYFNKDELGEIYEGKAYVFEPLISKKTENTSPSIKKLEIKKKKLRLSLW